ncbi:MAG TPA: RidA family protein [Verrucomicrobiae bacterium]|jgi:enamine deaminase RidA (YjgF/YER057c/UK114 family)|nr:RidA family protein [Verrucomicrobiae bacterium]
MTIERLEPGAWMSQAVIHADTIYLAGQVAQTHRGADITQQTREIFARIDALLSAAGSDRSALLSVTIWLRRPEDFSVLNAEWVAWLGEAPKPARTTVCNIEFVLPGWDIEVTVVAARIADARGM